MKMKKFNIKVTTKNNHTYTIDNIEESDFRTFANKIAFGGFLIFNDIMINSNEIEAIEVRP
jgi:hypothetical protein